MTGSGNDFVMVDGRVTTPADWSPQDIQAVCARGTGVGADGLVFVRPGSEPGAARMIYFNSDGSHAAMCGNAALCATWLAARLGLAPPTGMRLETDAGAYQARCGAGDGRAALGFGPVASPGGVRGLQLQPGEHQAALASVGVPHLVVLVDDVDRVDLPLRGRALRWDPALGPAGANVNFVSPGNDPSEWRMRTYERGVEGETLACGTGSVAAACALHGWGLGALPMAVITRSERRLAVQARRQADGGYGDVWLEGEARLVFRGVLA
ncbi:MAG TPA: diaminopimelate epimerase [Gemmatimonadales bacterium]|nr:diaminopimelate epimerase [Gemmatimonadales bacterium]